MFFKEKNYYFGAFALLLLASRKKIIHIRARSTLLLTFKQVLTFTLTK